MSSAARVDESTVKESQEKKVDIIEKKPEEDVNQINFKKFREAREQDRIKREEAERRAIEKANEAQVLKEAMEALLSKKSAPSQDQDHEETEEQKIQKIVSKALEERDRQYQDQRRQQEAKEFPEKLKSVFPDFDQVCSAENVDYLEFNYPEIATPFKHMPDGFEKWAAVYKTVKRLIPNSVRDKDNKKMSVNSNKPQSMSVPGIAPTGDSAPHQLDDKRRADNWARMQRVMRGG